MRKLRVIIGVGSLFLSVGLLVWAQGRKAGLWEVTSTQTWQQSPLPAGMPIPAGGNSPFAGGTHTSQVCLTQQQLDKYGAIPPQTRGECQVTNVNKTANGMTAEMACSGRMSGKGNVESSWTDGEHAKSKVHFTGSIQLGPNSKPVEWTTTATSVFKGSDCGSVKPMVVPDK